MKHTLLIAALCTLTSTSSALERLHYHVKYGFLKAGEAEIVFDKQADGYTYTALAWTTLPMFKIYERIAITGDANFRPANFTMQQIEKDYRATKTLVFNKDDTATYQKAGDAPTIYPAHGAERDYMSLLFKLRYDDQVLVVGDTITENVVGMGGPYKLNLNVLEKKKIFTPATKWQEVFVLQPEMNKLAPNSGTDDNWLVYITADERRLPIRLDAKLKFGRFKTILQHIGDKNTPSKAPKGLQSGAIFSKS